MSCRAPGSRRSCPRRSTDRAHGARTEISETIPPRWPTKSRVSDLDNSAHVWFADAYADGTIWFALKDAEGRYAEVCIDGRRGSPTRRRLCYGVVRRQSPDPALRQPGPLPRFLVTSSLFSAGRSAELSRQTLWTTR